MFDLSTHLPLLLRYIEAPEQPLTLSQPEPPPVRNRAAQRAHDRLTSTENAAEFCKVSERTILNWANRGFFPIYQRGKFLYADLDEIEAAFLAHPKEMRDGRRSRWSPDAVVLPLPEAMGAVVEGADQ